MLIQENVPESQFSQNFSAWKVKQEPPNSVGSSLPSLGPSAGALLWSPGIRRARGATCAAAMLALGHRWSPQGEPQCCAIPLQGHRCGAQAGRDRALLRSLGHDVSAALPVFLLHPLDSNAKALLGHSAGHSCTLLYEPGQAPGHYRPPSPYPEVGTRVPPTDGGQWGRGEFALILVPWVDRSWDMGQQFCTSELATAHLSSHSTGPRDRPGLP